jgi:hypothetical protein
MSTHQLDQAVFRAALPEDIDWEPFPSMSSVGPSRCPPILTAMRAIRGGDVAVEKDNDVMRSSTFAGQNGLYSTAKAARLRRRKRQ